MVSICEKGAQITKNIVFLILLKIKTKGVKMKNSRMSNNYRRERERES